MNTTYTLIRTLFTALCVLFTVAYSPQLLPGFDLWMQLGVGLMLGIGFAGTLLFVDKLFKRFNLRSFNIIVFGLFCGYLMGNALLWVTGALLEVGGISVSTEFAVLMRAGVFLFALYLGLVMTVRAAEELYVSIPFVKFKEINHKKKDIILDPSTLMDSRLIDLAGSGLLDHHFILPRFTLQNLYKQLECEDEGLKSKARRSLDVVKRLEGLETLGLRYDDTDFPEIGDPVAKLIRLARLHDANILTAEMNSIQQSTIESMDEIRVINIHNLANKLKPIQSTGEVIKITVQHTGKEPKQGVGYLDDGTMVVVNGGGDYIRQTIKAQVLRVKHSSSGRMIFCNAMTEGDDLESDAPRNAPQGAKSFYALK